MSAILPAAPQLRPADGPARMTALILWAMGRHRWLVTGWIAALLASCAATMAFPRVIALAVEAMGYFGPDLDQVFLLLGAVGAAMGITTGIRYYFIARLGDHVVADIKQRLFEHALRLDAAFYDRVSSGEIASRLATDLAALQGLLGANTSIALRCIITLTGAIVMLYLTSPTLMLWAALIVPAVVLPFRLRSGYQRKMITHQYAQSAEAQRMAAERLGSIACVHAHGRQGYERENYRKGLAAARETSERVILVRASLNALGSCLLAAGLVLLMQKGFSLVEQRVLTAGDVAQFTMYAGMAGMSGLELLEVWAGLDRMRGALERLDVLTRERAVVVPPEGGAEFPTQPPRIAFRQVDFTYPTGDRPSLSGFDLEVAAGTTVALVGPSGAGKSTIRALLQRFYDPTLGVIEIDGTALSDFDLVSLRRGVAIVPQAPWLCTGSVALNIAYGNPDATPGEIEEASRAVGLHDFIATLPKGYDTLVGDGGSDLSGGQRQLVAIARAWLMRAPVIILDEATSALDARSEHLIRQAIRHVTSNRTTFVIAHRLSTILDADAIVVMDGGRIIAVGTHVQLMTSCPLYREMATLQFLHDGQGHSQAAQPLHA